MSDRLDAGHSSEFVHVVATAAVCDRDVPPDTRPSDLPE